MIRHALAFLLLAYLVSGCCTGRVADLRDCGRASVGIGYGLDATAKAGFIVHPSLGLGSKTRQYGCDGRNRYGAWEEKQIVWPVECLLQSFGRSLGDPGTPFASYERHKELYAKGDPEPETSWLPILAIRRNPDVLSYRQLTDTEIGVTFIAVSLRASINPLEILDLILGFVGLDLAGDDSKGEGLTKTSVCD